MNEETINKAMELLEVLAVKMGTTADHLWEILIKQAYVDFVVEIVTFAIVISIGFGLYKLAKKLKPEYSCDEPLFFIGGAVAFCLWGIFMFASIVCTLNSIGGVLNPEYFAFKEITKLIGG